MVSGENREVLFVDQLHFLCLALFLRRLDASSYLENEWIDSHSQEIGRERAESAKVSHFTGPSTVSVWNSSTIM